MGFSMIFDGYINERRKLTPTARFLFDFFYEEAMDANTNVLTISKHERRDIRDHLVVADGTITRALNQLKKEKFIKEKSQGVYMVNPELVIRTSQERKPFLIDEYETFETPKSTKFASLIKAEDVPH